MKLSDAVAIWGQLPTFDTPEPLEFTEFAMAAKKAVGIEYDIKVFVSKEGKESITISDLNPLDDLSNEKERK